MSPMPSRRHIFSRKRGDAVGVAESIFSSMRPRCDASMASAERLPARHRVDAESVADVVEPHDLGEVVDLAEAAEHVGRLVLGTLDLEALVPALEARSCA